LNDGRDEESHECQEAEEKKSTSPNIAEEERHDWEFQRLASSGSINPPLANHISESCYLCITIDIAFVTHQSTVTIRKMGKNDACNNTHCVRKSTMD